MNTQLEQSKTALLDRDLNACWHPFTQMKGAYILPISRAEGINVYDENDKKYIDGFSSWWTCIHGHAHPYIGKAIYEQYMKLEHVAFGGFTHPKAVEAAERLIGHLPEDIKKVFYGDNGSTANEIAVKMAIQYFHNRGEKRSKFIAFEGSYHGDTFGAMSIAPRGLFNVPFENFLFDCEFIPTPTNDNINEVERQLSGLLSNDDVIGFIYEPIIQGVRGMIVHDPKLLNRLIGLCKQNGALAIADEVMTGFGRTGKWFASDYMENKPDIITLSKALTAGAMPMSVTACTQEIYDAFYDDDRSKALLHGHTFTGNPLGCATICANLDLLEQQDTWDSIQMICEKQSNFAAVLNAHSRVGEVNNFGTVLSFELVTSEETSYFNDYGKEAYEYFLQKGLILRPLGNIMCFVPPFIFKENELDDVYSLIIEFLDR